MSDDAHAAPQSTTTRDLRPDVLNAVFAELGAVIARADNTERAVEAGVALVTAGLLVAARNGGHTDAAFYNAVDACLASLQRDPDVWELLKLRGEIDLERARLGHRGAVASGAFEVTHYIRNPTNGLVLEQIKEKL